MAQQVSVHGKFANAGLPAQGTVTFSDSSFSVDSVTGVVNTPVQIVAYLDQNGEFYASLPLNVGQGSSPAPRTYHASVAVEGTTLDFDFVLTPAALSVEFSDIVPVGQVPTLPPQYVSSIGGLTGVITYNDFVAKFPALAPTAGKSAYQLWLDNGHSGTIDAFFAALRGLQGLQGLTGPAGGAGPAGERGPRGSVGPQGRGFKVDVVVAAPANLSGGGGAIGSDGQTTLFPKDSMAAVLSTAEFWFFDGVQWQNLGSYRGPQGPAGATATKASIGLGLVDNTSDMGKPVSTAQAKAISDVAAVAGKVKSVNGATGDVVIGAQEVGLGNVSNTTTALWPFSDALVTKLGQIDTAIQAKYTRPAGGSALTFLRGDDTWKAIAAADVGLGKLKNFDTMTELDLVTNLGSLVVTGTWVQSKDSATLTSLSYPVPKGGFLQVLANNSGTKMVVQVYYAYGYGSSVPIRVYTRSCYDVQAWSQWRQVYVSGIENISATTLQIATGQGFTPQGSASVTSLVYGGPTADAVLDGSTTAVVYPFAPSAASSWTAFPQGVSAWRLQSGVNGSPGDYPVLTGLLVNHRTNVSPRQELYPPYGNGFVRHFVSGAWTPWKPIEQEMAMGQLTVSLTANTVASFYVPFPNGRFNAVPNVMVEAQTTVPDRVQHSTNGTDQSGFTLWANRTTSSNTTFNWVAIST